MTSEIIFFILGYVIIILVWKGYGKIEMQFIRKNHWRIFKISIAIAVGI